MIYNKLIRDKIAELMRSKGITFTTHVATDEEYWQKLKEKLREELEEFIESETMEEMADIFEVITAINSLKGWNIEDIVAVQKIKREERGGFTGKIILEETQE